MKELQSQVTFAELVLYLTTTKSRDYYYEVGRLRRAVAELRRAGPGFVATRSGDLAELGLRRAGRKNMVNPINSNLFFFHLHL